jgi:hypothetical protein
MGCYSPFFPFAFCFLTLNSGALLVSDKQELILITPCLRKRKQATRPSLSAFIEFLYPSAQSAKSALFLYSVF